jgi:hypothetical protein
LDQQYDEQVALRMNEFARVVVCDKEAIAGWTCGEMCDATNVVAGRVRLISHERAKLQGFVAQVPTEAGDTDNTIRCVVAFRGSDASENWVTNFNFNPVPWKEEWCEGCRVHGGYVDAYEKVRGDLNQALIDMKCTRVRFTGHSLGAALTTLASMDARRIPGLLVETTYTFGMPRIGNKAFVDAYLKAATADGVQPAMWRVVHYNDPIPRFAPSTKHVFPFAHIPTEVWYTRGFTQHRVCVSTPDVPEDVTCMWSHTVWDVMFDWSQHLSYFKKTFHSGEMPDACRRA